MRLSLKLMAAVTLVVALLLSIHGYLSVKREIELFQKEMELRAYIVGRVLVSSMADVWRLDGSQRVMDILRDANRSEGLIRVRWVWFDVPPGDKFAPHVNIEYLTDLRLGKEILIPRARYEDADYFFAYFPVPVDSTRLSALELSQPLRPMKDYIRSTIIRKAALLLGFIIIGAILNWWLGAGMIGRPVQQMVAQARKVGEGDLEVETTVGKHHDELAELAKSLNNMVEGLRVSRRRLQEETARRIETIEQLNRSERLATVGKLASGLAHELGTPLNVVSGRAKMIAAGTLKPEESVMSATVIKDQSERMTKIIRQLLDFARSRAPQIKSENLGDVAEKVRGTLDPIATQGGSRIETHFPEREVSAQIDREQIQQVLSNLIVNAIHAMPDGGTIEIEVGEKTATPPADVSGTTGKFAFISITDHGVGIRKEDMERIFTPFFTTKDVGKGTGLGLSIAHGIVKEHAGWLSVESEFGKGSCFSVFLPLGDNA